jgi:multiple sugar transport system ATP-binding protein
MTTVELTGITKRFPGVTALKDVSFDVQDGEFFVLLGPTGAGKTTTLRIVAGLEHQDEGSVLFDGEVMDQVTPADRDVAFVFQQYSLYPTMSVYDNLAFPLRAPLRRLPEATIREKVHSVAETLHISHLINRKTAHLSGGEMQRVSIGRAIVREPRIFLMDEPLSNLDAKLRESLRVELQHLQKTQGSTTLFVTHDQIEALTMADRIAVLSLGRIVQIGSPKDIYDRPATTFVARLVGTPRINLYGADRSDGTLAINGSGLTLPVPAGHELPRQVQLGIRPEDIRPTSGGEFQGELILTEPLGVETILHIQADSVVLLCLVPGITTFKLGDTVRFDVAHDRVHYFDVDGTRI